MADMQSRDRSNTGKNDVPVNTKTQQETTRSAPSARRDVTRRSDLEIGRDPFGMLGALHREMNRLFDDFGFGGFGRMAWTPQIEVRERDGKLHICADLPGLTRDDVKVEVMDNNLTIEGERRSEQQDERSGWSERSYGRFFRSIPLPEGVNPDTAKASFENGVLDIAFDTPKLDKPRGRRIEIGETKK